jgi:CPA1 family monovalent cation:H+ antiporter
MDILITILLLLFCLLFSNIVSHYVPSVPTALTQIATGIVLAVIIKDISFKIETEWFLLLFVAPLLYNDGSRFPREELWEMRLPILGNAIILVILTTLGGGYFIHWMIPGLPLTAAFALAAILSPTDPVAVNGIAKRIHIPQKVLSLVRGESLINDASGLVAFNYAITAVVTGYFLLNEAILNFSYKFLAGAIAGLILGFLVTWLRFALRRQGIVDVTFHSLLQILTPFAIYIITEDFLHASGVIGVVAAGIVHALVRERTETMIAEEQILTENIWSIALFVLNGVVFLLLGLNIPSSMAEAVADPSINNYLIIGYAAVIGAVILGIRFIWSYLFFYVDYYHSSKAKDVVKPDFQTNLTISLTGVRGAVTMAGVLSIPYFLANGDKFPQRSLILFLAAGVILFTLIAATLFLPVLSKREAGVMEAGEEMELGEAKRKILLEAIKRIRLAMNDENRFAAYELIDEYKTRLRHLRSEQMPYDIKISEIRLMALKKEREYVHAIMAKREMSEAVLESFEKSLDRREEALSANVNSGLMYLIGRMIRNWRRYRGSSGNTAGTLAAAKLRISDDIQLKALQATYDFLEGYVQEYDQANMVYSVMQDYKRMIERLEKPARQSSEEKKQQKEDLRMKVIDIERSEIIKMFEAGEITKQQAKELRRFVNNIESVVLYEYVE